MRQEARFLLAITLMILVLIGTNILFPPIPPEEAIGPEGDAPGQVDGSGVTGVRRVFRWDNPKLGVGATADQPDAFADRPGAGPSPFDRPAPVTGAPEDTVVVEGPLYRLEWSTTGARLLSAQLLQFQSFDHEGVVELIVEGSEGALAMQLRVGEGALDLGAETFEVEPADGLRLDEGGGPRTLTFRYRHPSGALTLETAYTFDPSSYLMDVRTELVGADGALLVTSMGSGLQYNERNRNEESRIMGYVTNHLREGIDDETLSRVDSERVQEGPLLWAALKSKYFIFALVPGRGGSEQYLGGLTASPAPGDDQAAIAVTQAVGLSGVLEHRIFMGPQERDLLTAFGNGLEEANPYGYRWMRPVVRPVVDVVLAILNFLHANLNVGYGWVLIIFGVMYAGPDLSAEPQGDAGADAEHGGATAASGNSEEVQGPAGKAAEGDDEAVQGPRLQPVGGLPADASSMARADHVVLRVQKHDSVTRGELSLATEPGCGRPALRPPDSARRVDVLHAVDHGPIHA